MYKNIYYNTMQIESVNSIELVKPTKRSKPSKPSKLTKLKMSYTEIETYLSKLIIDEYGIYYINNDEDDEPKSFTDIQEIKKWGTVNKLFFENDDDIVFNKKKLHFLQKKNNIHIKIYNTGSTTYVSPVDMILDGNNSFEYNMDILVDGNIVYSMNIDSSSFDTNDLKEIKSEMFKTFDYISDKYSFVILYLLS